MNAVETYQLTKYYGKGRIKALEDFNLLVSPGMIFSLLGPNGAGKTTLIKLLLGICFPTRGDAKILGKNIKDYRVHRNIGYLAENHRFPDFLTAQQILFSYGKMGGVNSLDLRDKIPNLLALVRLKEWGNVKIRKYSKGMLQRLGIAQALINDPELLFLDEPTDGIDPVGRREVRDILLELRNQGRTIFLNSHLLSEVERISDEIAILKNGELIERGDVQQFISIEHTYQIKVEDGQSALPGILKELEIDLKIKNDSYVVSVSNEQQLNHLVDKIREQKIIIQAIIPYKISLEDFFIKVLEESQQP